MLPCLLSVCSASSPGWQQTGRAISMNQSGNLLRLKRPIRSQSSVRHSLQLLFSWLKQRLYSQLKQRPFVTRIHMNTPMPIYIPSHKSIYWFIDCPGQRTRAISGHDNPSHYLTSFEEWTMIRRAIRSPSAICYLFNFWKNWINQNKDVQSGGIRSSLLMTFGVTETATLFCYTRFLFF